MGFVRYVLQRFLSYLLVLFIGITIAFFLPRFMPGNPIDNYISQVQARAGQTLSPEAARQLRSSLQELYGLESWVLWNLTGGAVHACDLTNASRTQLLDIYSLRWSDELLDPFGVPPTALPDVRPSQADFGANTAIGRLPAGIPIASMIGDSHAALFGQAGFVSGTVKATYGTGSSLITPTSAPVLSQHGLSTTVAWALDHERVTYALEGNIPVTGAAVQWLGEFLSLPGSAAVAELAERVADSGGLYLVPALVGLGAPYWNDAARGLMSGLTRGSSAAHLARATLGTI